VHEWRVLGRNGPDLDVEIRCNGGTYIRALARDLGEATGSAAHLTALRRVSSGHYDVADAAELDALLRGEFRLLSPMAALSHMPSQELDDLDVRRVTHGQSVNARSEGEMAALYHDEQLVAVAAREGQSWRPKVVMLDG
jgi:tRNA pseudouridine55 synthase